MSKEIFIKSKRFPGTVIKVSEADYSLVNCHTWYITTTPAGSKRFSAFVTIDGETKKINLLTLIYRRMRPSVKTRVELYQINGIETDFTRSNISSTRELKLVKKMVIRDTRQRKEAKINGNDFCNALQANLKMRAGWGV